MLRFIFTSLLILALATPCWAQEAASTTASNAAGQPDSSDDDDDLYDDDDDLYDDDDDLFDDAPGDEQRDDEYAGEEEEAEEEAEKSAGIEEIMVTSQRRRSTLQDVPVSVTAFSASEIEAQGIQDIKGISNYTPNLEIKTAFAASNPTLFIRGVGLNDYNANAASSVAVYQDGIYMNSPAGQLFQFFDVQSVEVLRGPQGSLYGRNASAGAILVTSKEPTEDFELTAVTSYGRFNDFEVEAAVGGNIVDGLVDGRLAMHYRQRDGWMKNHCGGFEEATTIAECGISIQRSSGSPFIPAGLPTRLNNVDNWALRGLIRVRPDFLDMDWLFNLHGGQNLSQTTALFQAGNKDLFANTTQYVSRGPFPDFFRFSNDDPNAVYQNRVGYEFLDTLGGSAKGTMQFGDDVSFFTMTGYESAKRKVTDDFDSTSFSLSHNDTSDESWQFSQELGLDWQADDDLRFNFGAVYMRADLKADNVFRFNELRVQTSATDDDGEFIFLETPGVQFLQKYNQQLNSFSAFMHFNWSFLDDFTLDGGARYSWESKDFDIDAAVIRKAVVCPFKRSRGHPRCSANGRDPEEIGLVFEDPNPATVEQAVGTWSAPTGDISLTYSLTEDATVYGKYSRGYKPGGFNGAVVVSGDLCNADACPLVEAIKEETVDGWEVGVKSYWFDRRLMVNAALFFQKYNDLQVFVLENQGLTGTPLPKLINANAAQIYGLEAEIHAQPIPGMNIRSQFGWLEAVYLDFTRNYFRLNTGAIGRENTIKPVQSDFSGNRLVANPRFSWSGDMSYEISLGEDNGYLTPGFSWSFKTLTYFDPTQGRDRSGNDSDLAGARYRAKWGSNTFLGQPSYWLLDARLSYTTPDERFELTAWVRNLTDKVYTIDAFSSLEAEDRVVRVIGEPRTFGLTAWITF